MEETIITACNEFLLHGTWGAGGRTSPSLFHMKEGDGYSEERVGVIVAYEAYKGTEDLGCGTPLKNQNGIVLSSFALNVVHDFMDDRMKNSVSHQRSPRVARPRAPRARQ